MRNGDATVKILLDVKELYMMDIFSSFVFNCSCIQSIAEQSSVFCIFGKFHQHLLFEPFSKFVFSTKLPKIDYFNMFSTHDRSVIMKLSTKEITSVCKSTFFLVTT